jgi:hypothetical protein
MSPEHNRIAMPSSPIGLTIDTPVSVIGLEHNVSLSSPDPHSSASPTYVEPQTLHYGPLYENTIHVEYEHTDVILSPLTYAIDGVNTPAGEFYEATAHPAIQTHEKPPSIPTPVIPDYCITENCGSAEVSLPSSPVVQCPCCDTPMNVGHTCDQLDDTSSSIDNIDALSDIHTGSLSPPPSIPMHPQLTRSNPIIPPHPKPPDQIPPELIHMPRAYKYFMSLQHKM